MDETTFTMTAGDGTAVTVDRYDPSGEPRAIVQIAHGMGEHAARYRRLAEALTGAGYVVYANDHRGHCRTAGSADHHGDLGAGGWAGLVGDIGELSRTAREEHPGIPLVVIGHSMGSFALQQHLLDHSGDLDAAVLSGTSALDVIAAGIDPTKEIELSTFNAAFEPARTEYDWLTRDPEEVDKYIADAACGFGLDPPSTGAMLDELAATADPDRLAGIRDDLPIYLVSGDDDPLAGGGALIDLVGDRYRQAGVRDVTVARYPGARHEVFNETNRDEITATMVEWLDRAVGD
ncbi:MAG: alpha/beta fold hydrolase [Ilumatobacteraceae bacterium]